MNSETSANLWVPTTPDSRKQQLMNIPDTSAAAMAAACAHPTSQQSGVDDAINNQLKDKEEDYNKKKTAEKKKRVIWPKILNATYESSILNPKTPKPTKPKRPVPVHKPSTTKRKYTRKKKLDKPVIIVPDVITPEHLPIETDAAPTEKPSVKKTYSRANKLNGPANRVLDFDLICQPEVEDPSKVQDLVPQICSSENTSSLRGCRASLNLRCDCCLCHFKKVRVAIPKEGKRIRTSIRIAKAKRRGILPKRTWKKEDIKDFFKCVMGLTHEFVYTTKKRSKRVNRFRKETAEAKEISQCNVVAAAAAAAAATDGSFPCQINVNECKEPPGLEGISDSPKEVNPNPITQVCSPSGVDHSTTDKIIMKETKERKKQNNSTNKVAKTRGRKKKKLEAEDTWDENATLEDKVDIITKKFGGLRTTLDLVTLHAETKMEVNVEDETMRIWNILKDREDDGPDPVEEADESKQKWWEQERAILFEKINVFTVVMRVILGDRRFSPWKGSVVDSVVGVFLTQNVSDSLSSSAYMSLAAHYQVKLPGEDAHVCPVYESASTPEQQEDVAFEISNQESMERVDSPSPPMPNNDAPNTPNMTQVSKKRTKKKGLNSGDIKIDWEALRIMYSSEDQEKPRCPDTTDSVDWNAVRVADVNDIAKAISIRGQHNIMSVKIKEALNRIFNDHGSIDLEWLRDIPPAKAKQYLLGIHGLGLKSVECLRLLTLRHHAFPVDTNVGRIAVRLGWVPLQQLPENVEFHLIGNYPYMDKIQTYLWPRLYHLEPRVLYELHYLMITFGKVFCTTLNPHCKACPLRKDCKYYASKSASSRPALPGQEKGNKKASKKIRNPFDIKPSSLPLPSVDNSLSGWSFKAKNCEPIVEEPPSPKPEPVVERDIEDLFTDDPDEILSIDLTSQRFLEYTNENEENVSSTAIVTISAQDASRLNPQQKLIAKLRTEHLVYELPDSHPLLHGHLKREPDDPCHYLLAIWPQDESHQGPEHTVPGTLLLPCRSTMRGRFPLNGTYFQVNEVFVDYETSQCPINVPREMIWNLRKRTVYCGATTSAILKGLSMEEIQRCFWRGFICIRAFNRKTREPKRLPTRFHKQYTVTSKRKAEDD